MIDSSLLKIPKSILKVYGSSIEGGVGISTDTRKITPGDAFIALKGENFDGSQFLDGAIEKGAVCIVSENKDALLKCESKENVQLILVEDSLSYLQQLANIRVKSWKQLSKSNRVLALTGSNGKTTNKEIIFKVFSDIAPERFCITQGNLNNHIGVPLTILTVKDTDEYLILEMGTNNFGEINLLCEIAEPDYGLITNIGDSHLEFLIDRKGVLKEKSALYDYVVKSGKGKFVLYSDDEHLNSLNRNEKVVSIGSSNSDDFVVSFGRDHVSVSIEGSKFEIKPKNLFGHHNLVNCALCFSFCSQIFNEKDKVAKSIEEFIPGKNRNQIIQKLKYRVFLDAYNANPTSMRASMDGFLQWIKSEKISSNECCVVIGDMNELGTDSPSLHEDLGKFIRSLSFNEVFFVGRFNQYYKKGYGSGCQTFSDVDSLSESLPKIELSSKAIFIKGSRSVQLEKLIDFLD